MSIGNNTTGLQRILQAVNNLPEAGSGGVTIQRATGSVTLDSNGTATVNCGFKPDMVAVTASTYPAVVAFFDGETERQVFSGDWTVEYPFIFFYIAQTNSGFNCTQAGLIAWDWNTTQYSGSANYVAIKYTE